MIKFFDAGLQSLTPLTARNFGQANQLFLQFFATILPTLVLFVVFHSYNEPVLLETILLHCFFTHLEKVVFSAKIKRTWGQVKNLEPNDVRFNATVQNMIRLSL